MLVYNFVYYIMILFIDSTSIFFKMVRGWHCREFVVNPGTTWEIESESESELKVKMKVGSFLFIPLTPKSFQGLN